MKVEMKGPTREKPWTERDVDEKLEALRSEVVKLSNAMREVRYAFDRLLEHGHRENGTMVGSLLVGNPHPKGFYIPPALRDEE